MAKIEVSDGVGLIKLTALQRYLLQRPFVAFELRRIIAVYEEVTPKRRLLGVRKTKNLLFMFKTGEYLRGVKKVLFLGPGKTKAIRILLLNPDFDEIYLFVKDREEMIKFLRKYASRPDLTK